jgi:hypothetical protein
MMDIDKDRFHSNSHKLLKHILPFADIILGIITSFALGYYFTIQSGLIVAAVD